MLSYAIMFSFAVLITLIGLYFANSRDSGDFEEVKKLFLESMAEISTVKSDVIILRGSMDRIAATGASNELRMNDILKRATEAEKQIASMQEHCVNLREGQYRLQDSISKKRPVIKVPKGPIEVEIYQREISSKKTAGLGRGMKAILRDAKQ